MIFFLTISSIVISATILAALAYYTFISTEKKPYKPDVKNTLQLSHGYTSYDLSGSDYAPVVVFIHGGTIPMCIWNDQVKQFTDAGFRVLRYDQYGRGGSERLQLPYTRQIFAEQLYDLLNSLKITRPVHLLGPSFGGAISVAFASRYPQQVKSIILISPVLNLPGSDSPLLKPIKISAIPVIGDFVFRTLIKKELLRRGQELTSCQSCKTIFLNQFSIKGTEKSLLSAFRSDAYGDYLKETKMTGEKIKNIFLIRGKNDREVTQKMVEQVRGNLPGCRFLELDNSGHSPFSGDNGPAFTGTLIDFFRECT